MFVAALEATDGAVLLTSALLAALSVVEVASLLLLSESETALLSDVDEDDETSEDCFFADDVFF